MKFDGKIVIVTGSSQGIGSASAVQFAFEGASVTIHGLTIDGFKEAISDIQEEQTLRNLVVKTVEKFGKIDVLVNNTGLSLKRDADQKAIEFYVLLNNINCKSMVRLIQLAEPHLEKTKGNVVITSSVSALLPRPKMLFYSMSKAAVDHYMHGRTHELAKKELLLARE
ncbi:hypothetical protein L596_016037 [Steinernema carpocapsae]|uniref:Uncharacterized protein n=1 Tax=Steinernema carpocapsae TaxID=34508 RepID=A0A4U5NHV1_STECR|nr:hypothetical protein L596_016037 [Steinernema carpocapsae]